VVDLGTLEGLLDFGPIDLLVEAFGDRPLDGSRLIFLFLSWFAEGSLIS